MSFNNKILKIKPNVIFFSRAHQSDFFPLLKSENYVSIHVTLTLEEKKKLEAKNLQVEYCFETFNKSVTDIPDDYLLTSYNSDRFLYNLNIEERKNFLNREVAFWAEIFDRYKPLAVINEIVAIEIAEVMYIEAKKRDIKYLAFMDAPIKGYSYWVADPISLSMDDEINNVIPSEESRRLAEEYIRNIINKNERPYYIIPFLIRQNKYLDLFRALKRLIFHFLKRRRIDCYYSGSKISIDSSKLQFEIAIKSFIKKYNAIDEINNKEIVVYPLHYEPEATLLYFSEFFSNQVALIENLVKCLTLNQVLVVKEHPAQAGMLLTKRFQKLLEMNPQLYFLRSSISSFDLIKKSKIIVTLTSNFGWEGMFFGKPVFLLGEMFYDKYENTNRFNSFEHLRESIRSKNYKIPDIPTLTDYTAKLFERSFKGVFWPCDILYSDENIKNIISAIEKKIKDTI